MQPLDAAGDLVERAMGGLAQGDGLPAELSRPR